MFPGKAFLKITLLTKTVRALFSRVNMTSSHEKITCYFTPGAIIHPWKYHIILEVKRSPSYGYFPVWSKHHRFFLGNFRLSSEIFRKCSETIDWPSDNFWRIFGNLRKIVKTSSLVNSFWHLTRYLTSSHVTLEEKFRIHPCIILNLILKSPRTLRLFWSDAFE